MDAWRDRVVAAAADWVYLPDDADRHVTDEVAVVAYPESWALPTQAARIRSSRTPAELIAEVDAVVAAWGRSTVDWWIDPATTPADLEEHLLAVGAEHVETVTVLAVDLTGPLPDFEVPSDVSASVADDFGSLHTFGAVNASGWDSPPSWPDEVAGWLDAARGGTTFRVLATADGVPCATGGMELFGDVARLWAGVTLPEFRGRGAYRAVLAERLRVARDHGATMGLVKGRISTSAPILRRLGFDVFDNERAYRRDVG